MTTKHWAQFYFCGLWLTTSVAFAQIAPWEKLAPMPTPRYGHAAVVWRNQIVVLGGRDAQDQTLAQVESYDPLTNTWSNFTANLREPRASAAAVVYHNQMYVIGGNRDDQVLSTVERFNVQSGQWEVLAHSLQIGRDGPATAVLNDTIFVIGGYEETGAYLKAIEYFKPATNEWLPANWRLSLPRASLAAVSWRDTLYTFGGLFFGPVAVLERYHAAAGEQRRKDMHKARGNMAATVFKNRLWAIGGSTQEGPTDAVECYDPSQDQWFIEQPLAFARALHAAVVYNDKLYIMGGQTADQKVLADLDVTSSATTVVENDPVKLPTSFEVLAYPNPFVAQVHFIVPKLKAKNPALTAEIFALDGARVRTLLMANALEQASTLWNGRDDAGIEVANGVYFVVVRMGEVRQSKKILKLGLEGGRR